MPDLYATLGVAQDASDDDIRKAYKRAAIKWHPDKNRHQPEAAEAKFKEISLAYGVLSDHAKRSKYDAKGLDGLNNEDLLDTELDLSSLGTMSSVFLAMFSRMGLRVKTMVAPQVLDGAESGQASLRPLEFGVPIADRVGKHNALFYELQVSQDDIDSGFCVRVTSPNSRFKLLTFKKRQGAALELWLQDDSVKEGKSYVAGIYFFTFTTYRLGPPPSAVQFADDPEAALFRRLDDFEPRQEQAAHLVPGSYVFAVYGDNFLKASSYSIEALRERDFRQPAQEVRRVEGAMLKARDAVRAFEGEYRRAKKAYEEAVAEFERQMNGMSELMAEREVEYGKIRSDTPAAAPETSRLDPLSGFKKLFGGGKSSS